METRYAQRILQLFIISRGEHMKVRTHLLRSNHLWLKAIEMFSLQNRNQYSIVHFCFLKSIIDKLYCFKFR